MYDDDSIVDAAPGTAGGGVAFSKIVVGPRVQRRPPRDFQRALVRAGGLNRFDEPNFRVLWGWEPIEFIYSRRSGCYERRPRYIVRDRWIIEKWFPPENYGTPYLWRMQFTQVIEGQWVDLLGPFPSRGAYEQLCTLQTPEGDYLDLSVDVCDKVVDLVRASRELSPWARKERVVEQIENPNPGYDAYADDLLKDMQPVFDLRPHAFLGHKNVLKGKYEQGGPN